MDRLWSPWRLNYVTGDKPTDGCVFCLGDRDRSPEGAALIVHGGRAAYVILNKFPYNNGHLMVVPYRHVPSIGDLPREEWLEIADLVRLAEAVLIESYAPGGINVGINLGRPAGAGIHEHLHVHLVPRWIGDSNFMTVIGETRVLPEELGATAARLQPLFAKHAPARS
jgi:ATP adenylyltransferase